MNLFVFRPMSFRFPSVYVSRFRKYVVFGFSFILSSPLLHSVWCSSKKPKKFYFLLYDRTWVACSQTPFVSDLIWNHWTAKKDKKEFRLFNIIALRTLNYIIIICKIAKSNAELSNIAIMSVNTDGLMVRNRVCFFFFSILWINSRRTSDEYTRIYWMNSR